LRSRNDAAGVGVREHDGQARTRNKGKTLP